MRRAPVRLRYSAAVREALQARYQATLEKELSLPGTRAPRRGFRLGLPPALRESMIAAAALSGGACPEPLIAWYCERMPRMLVDQMLRGEDLARRLLWRPLVLERLPRLASALDGLIAGLVDADFAPEELLAARSPAELVAQRPCVAALVAPTLFGGGLPLVGAYPAERDLLNRELAVLDPDAVLDRRLSGNVVHELCHGLRRETQSPPPPWILLEAAALLLGATAFPRHVFPDVAGEAVAGVSLFVLVGQGLARLFGRSQLFSLVVRGSSLTEAFGVRAAAALETAAWQDFLRRPEPPFARDALSAASWIKLADAMRADGPLSQLADHAAEKGALAAARALPDLLREAERLRFPQLPWYQEEPTAEDLEMARTAVLALLQVNTLAPTYQTHPAEAPSQRLVLDVEACVVSCAARPEGVFGEPARWIVPPPLCRLLRARGARTVSFEGATRAQAAEIGEALLETALGGEGPLAEETVLRWSRSRSP